jgi:flagellar biosynthetic protein FliO
VPDPLADTSLAWLAVSVFLKLGLVLVLMYACLYVIRRLKSSTNSLYRRQLAILETLHLSPRQKLHLVQAGSTVLLIGATDDNLSVLSEVEMKEVPPEVQAEPQAEFISALKKIKWKNLATHLLPWMEGFTKPRAANRQESHAAKPPTL